MKKMIIIPAILIILLLIFAALVYKSERQNADGSNLTSKTLAQTNEINLKYAQPSAITDLAVINYTEQSILLSWTAPNADGGKASQYDLRFSTSPITADVFESAAQLTGEPVPLLAGSRQTMRVWSLSPSTKYYFAMKAADKNWNWSGISNIATGTTSSSILSLLLTPSSGSVKRGGNISATVTMTNRTPISYPVSLGCNLVFAELPNSDIVFELNKNASCSFVPSSVNPPTNSALTISTASTFPKGTYGIIVLGQTINIPLTSATFSLTITD